MHQQKSVITWPTPEVWHRCAPISCPWEKSPRASMLRPWCMSRAAWWWQHDACLCPMMRVTWGVTQGTYIPVPAPPTCSGPSALKPGARRQQPDACLCPTMRVRRSTASRENGNGLRRPGRYPPLTVACRNMRARCSTGSRENVGVAEPHPPLTMACRCLPRPTWQQYGPCPRAGP